MRPPITPSVIEAHIERGVGHIIVREYLKDVKLRIMVIAGQG